MARRYKAKTLKSRYDVVSVKPEFEKIQVALYKTTANGANVQAQLAPGTSQVMAMENGGA